MEEKIHQVKHLHKGYENSNLIVKTVLPLDVSVEEHHKRLKLKILCCCLWLLAKNLQCKLPK